MSSDADTSCFPSEEKETLLTDPEWAFRLAEFPCLNELNNAAELTYTLGIQNLIVQSLEPEAIRFPDGENSTEYAGPS